MTLRAELDFLLFDWLQADALCTAPPYDHLDAASLRAVLEAADQLAAQHFAPHAAASDAQEPHVADGRVELLPAIGAALAAYREAGFFADEAPLAEGGMQLPQLVRSGSAALFSAANVATGAYPFLTKAAANLLRAFGTPAQRARYLAPMVEGRWYGTMCLSEPHAGSSLGDLRCAAMPRGDGTYALRGSKMWISCGEHELSENIVHLVLARLPEAPPGSKGISLFVVPRRRVDVDGRAGARNGIALVGLNHKLGYRGAVNCLLDFGADGETVGELLGAPHDGLRLMFRMMNEARIGVGVGAAALGIAGVDAALDYARERRQGRSPAQPDPRAPMRPIVEHADVRRMLLRGRALASGSLALCLYAARLVDAARAGSDPDAEALLDLLTPVVKAWPAQHALAANDLAIQVLGGAGYTRDFPLERLWRDNRLNPIHEGTNGIQAIDLVGRKLLGDGGRALALLLPRVQATLARARDDGALAAGAQELAAWPARLGEALQVLGTVAARDDAEAALANASLLADAFGHVVVGWLWLDQALCAGAALAAGDPRVGLLEGRRLAARYFLQWELPAQAHALALVARADRTVLDAPPDWL